MSANIEQIKAMLERTGKNQPFTNKKVDLDKERLQLEATVNEEPDKSLEEDPKIILDDFCSNRPYWDDERRGVVIPLLGIVLDAKNIANDENWDSARTLCAAAGQRMFTKQEAYVLMWQKDEINAILKEHQGDLLDGWFWTDTEYEKYSADDSAWCLSFGSGLFSYYSKYHTLTVRAVAAL